MESTVQITIPTPAGATSGVLTVAASATEGVIMVGGAGGGSTGPSGIYAPLAAGLLAQGITALRMEYRQPNRLAACTVDVLAGIALLHAQGIAAVTLIGWSFGGAVVIAAGSKSPLVVGVATLASQTYGTEAVAQLAPKRLLVTHGTVDTVLPPVCAEDLYERAREPKEITYFVGDGHGFERHTQDVLALLLMWSVRCLHPPRARTRS